MLWDQEQRNTAPALDTSGQNWPTTFGETFSAAWSRNTLFSQDYFGENDRMSALNDYLDKVKRTSGEDIGQQLDYRMPEGAAVSAQDLLRQANGKVNELKNKNPALGLEPMSPDELSANAVAKRKKADADFEETIDRPRGPGATVGRWLGGAAAGIADPINLAALPIAPEGELGILGSALRWGAIAGSAGAVSTAIAAPYREQIEPGYIASGAPLAEITEQAAFGAAGGAAFPAARAIARPVVNRVADSWDRVRGNYWPTTVKDAGNIVSSAANINQSNIYPGIDGSAAHEQALAKTTNDVLAGRPVDVSQHITPELEARTAQPEVEAHRLQAQGAAAAAVRPMPIEPAPPLPFERTAAEAAAEARKQDLVLDVYDAAREGGYDDIPMAEAGQIADKLIDATPEQAQKIMRDLRMSPRQVAEAPAVLEPPAEPLPVPVTPVENIHAPDFQNAVRADVDRELVAPPREGSLGELKQMLDRAAPTEELLAHPAVQKAIRETYHDRAPTMTPEEFADAEWRTQADYEFARPDGTIEKVQGWDAAVNRLVDEAKGFAKGEYKEGHHAIIVMGPPAGGKSSISQHLAQNYGAAIVDPDEAKKVIPGYDDGAGAGATHYESVELAKAMAKQIGRDGGNIILPKVGQELKTIRSMIDDLKANGYTVDLVHTSVPIDVAQRRNLSRFLESGRLVDPDYIAKEVDEKPLENTHILEGETNGQTVYVDNLERTVQGSGPLADSIRSGFDVGAGVRRGISGIAGGTRAEEAAARRREGQYPASVDINGNISYQSIDKALEEVDGYKTAAEQIAACAAPAPQPAEAA